jgi:SecY
MAATSEGSRQQVSRLNRFGPIAVTLVALVAYRLATQLPLPGLDLASITQITTGASVSAALLERFSILALGVLPWFSALTLVALAAIVLPETWIGRFTSDGQAQPFSRIVMGLALTIAALEGVGLAEAMMAQPNLVVEPGTTFLVSAVTTLVGGTAFLIALGLVIERLGLGHGFWIVLAASMLAQLPSYLGVMLLMLREGIASPAATIVASASTVALIALTVGMLEARRRANVTSLAIVIWPLVLASLASGLIVGIASVVLPEGSDDTLDRLAKMLTNEPAGFLIGGVIASLFAARFASRDNDWRFFAPAVALIAGVQVHSIIAESLQVYPPFAGASLVIVTAVAYISLMRVRALMSGP